MLYREVLYEWHTTLPLTPYPPKKPYTLENFQKNVCRKVSLLLPVSA